MHNLKNTYHSDFKLAVKLGIIPSNIYKLIPKSTLHGFKHYDFSKLFGADFSDSAHTIDLLKQIAQSKSALNTACAVLRIASLCKSFNISFSSINSSKISLFKDKLVNLVHRIKHIIPKNILLKFIGLSASKFAYWNKNNCISSPFAICRKSFPNQLSASEIAIIHKAFTNPLTFHWPASSIAWGLTYSKKLDVHPSTIIKYAKAIKIISPFKLRKKIRKKHSINASHPNQVWHLDVTIIKTLDNVKLFLQIILDNFSRKIIHYHLSSSHPSGVMTKDLLYNAFSTISLLPKDSLSLIVDNGSENNNCIVQAFTEQNHIHKLIAQIDVSFSNSMIEALNKIIKYRYIFTKPILNLLSAQKVVDDAIIDYNNRPHYFLKGLSPNNAYDGLTFDYLDYKKRSNIARQKRLIDNKNHNHPCLDWSSFTQVNPL